MVFGAVSKWAEKALADGKITITEAAELGLILGGLLGIPTDVSIPTPGPPETAAAAYANEEAPEDQKELLTPKEQLMKPQSTDQGGDS